MVDEVALGKGFLRILPLSPLIIIIPMSRDILHLQVATIWKGKWANPGNRPKSNAVCGNNEALVRKIFKIFYGFKRLNDATGCYSLELLDKMWLIYTRILVGF